MSRLELPDGWAELASPRKVPERKRRRYVAAMTDLSQATAGLPQVPGPADENGVPGPPGPDPRHMGSKEMGLADTVGDMLILCLVREWSFGDVTVEVLQDLPTEQFDPLFRACRQLAPELLPDYTDGMQDLNPKARTSGSTGPPPGSSTAAPTFTTPSYAPTS